MSGEMQVDIVVGTTDSKAVERIEQQLDQAGTTRLDTTREPVAVTILAVTAGAIALAKSLVELWQSTHAKAGHPQPSITIEVESGATLKLGSVLSADEIEHFIASHAPTGSA
jgi:hypothetical protein